MTIKADLIRFRFDDLVEYFEYLDDLRESGETNMWGADAYIQAEYDLPHKDAGDITLAWMVTFSKDTEAAERATTALAKAEAV
ncbi:MAG: hypothetical protein ACR2RF_26255 [Geminicoccaceae bacterium]